MANRRIIDMKILTVIRLHEEGTSLRQISNLIEVHRRAVTEYNEVYKRRNLSLPQMSEHDDQSLLDLLYGLQKRFTFIKPRFWYHIIPDLIRSSQKAVIPMR
jgi:hypothetical protein